MFDTTFWLIISAVINVIFGVGLVAAHLDIRDIKKRNDKLGWVAERLAEKTGELEGKLQEERRHVLSNVRDHQERERELSEYAGQAEVMFWEQFEAAHRLRGAALSMFDVGLDVMKTPEYVARANVGR